MAAVHQTPPNGHDILDGPSARPLPGRTPGQIGLSIQRQKQGCPFVGDAIRYPVQLVQPELSSRVCADPRVARAAPRGLLDKVTDRGDWLVPMHFSITTRSRVRRLGAGLVPIDVDRIAP